MTVVVLAVVLVAAAAIGGAIVRPIIRRFRRIRLLVRAEDSVAAAVADGRMPTATGQALLQHLEGLRRICSGGGED
jgi:hypothetical protein